MVTKPTKVFMDFILLKFLVLRSSSFYKEIADEVQADVCLIGYKKDLSDNSFTKSVVLVRDIFLDVLLIVKDDVNIIIMAESIREQLKLKRENCLTFGHFQIYNVESGVLDVTAFRLKIKMSKMDQFMFESSKLSFIQKVVKHDIDDDFAELCINKELRTGCCIRFSEIRPVCNKFIPGLSHFEIDSNDCFETVPPPDEFVILALDTVCAQLTGDLTNSVIFTKYNRYLLVGGCDAVTLLYNDVNLPYPAVITTENFLQLLFDGFIDMLWTFDIENCFQKQLDAGMKLTGLSPYNTIFNRKSCFDKLSYLTSHFVWFDVECAAKQNVNSFGSGLFDRNYYKENLRFISLDNMLSVSTEFFSISSSERIESYCRKRNRTDFTKLTVRWEKKDQLVCPAVKRHYYEDELDSLSDEDVIIYLHIKESSFHVNYHKSIMNPSYIYGDLTDIEKEKIKWGKHIPWYMIIKCHNFQCNRENIIWRPYYKRNVDCDFKLIRCEYCHADFKQRFKTIVNELIEKIRRYCDENREKSFVAQMICLYECFDFNLWISKSPYQSELKDKETYGQAREYFYSLFKIVVGYLKKADIEYLEL